LCKSDNNALLPLGELDARLMSTKGACLILLHSVESFSVLTGESFGEELDVARLVILPAAIFESVIL
jgi:hypothetical protein